MHVWKRRMRRYAVTISAAALLATGGVAPAAAAPGNGDPVAPVVPEVTEVEVAGDSATVTWENLDWHLDYVARLVADHDKFCEPELGLLAARVPGSLHCVLDDLTAGLHEVEVVASDKDEQAATSEAYPFTVYPATPGEVSATAGVASITATWSPAAEGPEGTTGYRVTAQPGPATCTTIEKTTCVLGAKAGTSYTVTVVALAAGDVRSEPTGKSNAVTPTAPPVPDEPPATTLLLTTDQGRITTAAPGQDIVFIGKGFAAHSTVVISIYSSATVLGTTTTNKSGAFAKPVTIPAGLAVGGHTAVAMGVAPDGSPRSMALAITVDGLADTGTDPAPVLAVGAVLLAAGAAIMVGVRRRRRVVFRADPA